MNAWLVAAAVLLPIGLGACAWVTARGPAEDRLAGLTLASTVTSALFLLLAQGFNRPSYLDLALILAVLGPTGTLVFARFLGAEPQEDIGTAPGGEGEG